MFVITSHCVSIHKQRSTLAFLEFLPVIIDNKKYVNLDL